MNFPYKDYQVNILDTPEHEDFSEDTYRTLTAVDSVVMIIDATKGIEASDIETIQSVSYARYSDLHFINKLDREGTGAAGAIGGNRKCIGYRDISNELASRNGQAFPRYSLIDTTSNLSALMEMRKKHSFLMISWMIRLMLI